MVGLRECVQWLLLQERKDTPHGRRTYPAIDRRLYLRCRNRIHLRRAGRQCPQSPYPTFLFWVGTCLSSLARRMDAPAEWPCRSGQPLRRVSSPEPRPSLAADEVACLALTPQADRSGPSLPPSYLRLHPYFQNTIRLPCCAIAFGVQEFAVSIDVPCGMMIRFGLITVVRYTLRQCRLSGSRKDFAKSASCAKLPFGQAAAKAEFPNYADNGLLTAHTRTLAVLQPRSALNSSVAFSQSAAPSTPLQVCFVGFRMWLLPAPCLERPKRERRRQPPGRRRRP